MNNTMTWIASHLDAYHFNTDRARRFKHRLEVWSCLPLSRQTEEEPQLRQDFFSMFANNPFCEQNGLVTDERFETSSVEADGALLPGDITGASAEAYNYPSGEKDETVSAGHIVFEQNAAMQLVTYMEKESAGIKDRYLAGADRMRKAVQHEYAGVLNKRVTNAKGKRGPSPSTARAFFCLLFCLEMGYLIANIIRYLAVRGLNMNYEVLHTIPILPAAAACLAFMLLIFCLQFKRFFITVIKGPYRSWFVRRYKKYCRRADNDAAAVSRLATSSWYPAFLAAMLQTGRMYAENPLAPNTADATRAMLQNRPENTYAGDLAFTVRLWRGYDIRGEIGVSCMFFVVLLSVAARVISIWLQLCL